MLEITRKDLKISAINKLEPAQGSYNIPVKLNADNTYTSYTTEMRIGFYVGDAQIVLKSSYDADNKCFYIPGEALELNGLIYISFFLEDQSIPRAVMTNALAYEVSNCTPTRLLMFSLMQL